MYSILMITNHEGISVARCDYAGEKGLIDDVVVLNAWYLLKNEPIMKGFCGSGGQIREFNPVMLL
jgi:hypothetical protein